MSKFLASIPANVSSWSSGARLALASIALTGFALAGQDRPALADQTANPSDPDSDGDGLSDFQEIHKYQSDPKRGDSAGSGISDGDREQRREFSYSVRAVIRVMPPYHLATINDDYQDVRVLDERKEFVELDVVVYPLNTNADAIEGNPNWSSDYAGMKEFLAPGVTTNWDDAMRADLLRDLSADGIDPGKLTDKEVVQQVSRWLFKRSRSRNMFCTFYVDFPDGKPAVAPGLEQAFERDKGDRQWTAAEQFEHELLGRQMYASKIYGTCTSTAVYQTTVLRALGIPTRMILCIPLADGSDSAQTDSINQGLTHQRVRSIAYRGATAGGNSFSSHTFCEAFVGGRWRRLNSATLGQNVMEPGYLGLMIKVHTFNDLSEANLAATWGNRYAQGLRDDVFQHSNPYRLLEVSDHFGKYAQVQNPPADRELKLVTIGKAYSQESDDAPAAVRELKWSLQPGNGRFFIHCQEWLDNAGGYLQYKQFVRHADSNLALRAEGQPDVACHITQNFYTLHSQNLCELEVVIPAAEYAKMVADVTYTLHPINGKEGHEWRVRDGLTVTRATGKPAEGGMAGRKPSAKRAAAPQPPNPPADEDLKLLTIEKAYWKESEDAPDEVRALKWSLAPGSARLFIHCQEWIDNGGYYLQYKRFMLWADQNFVLQSEGQPDVACRVTGNHVANGKTNLRELEIFIPAAEYAKMTKDVAYTLHPPNAKDGYEWRVRDGLTLKRQ